MNEIKNPINGNELSKLYTVCIFNGTFEIQIHNNVF